MSRISLRPFVEHVRRTDDHAGWRLDLLAQAERALAAGLGTPHEEAVALADRLERWRYQLLDEWRARRAQGEAVPDARDSQLAEALDMAARELAGRPELPPRAPRAALLDDASAAAVGIALEALDPRFPLAELTARARSLTEDRFGVIGSREPTGKRRMMLYAPLYVSSHCVNNCSYCGFSFEESIPRRHLTTNEAMEQAARLQARGFEHLLLVAGDFPSRVGADYLGDILQHLVEAGVEPAVEIAPQSTADYARLRRAGARGVTLYMETYDEAVYARHHTRGPKASYDWRLEASERAAEAGMEGLGLGVLLGLDDPRRDVLALVQHGAYLQQRFPGTRLAFSLPRIHRAPDGFEVPQPVDDELFVRLYAALRLAFPAAELVLSTREPQALRNRLATLCITQMSAGSSTVPGGYHDDESHGTDKGEQFPVVDDRSPEDVATWLTEAGMTPAWSWRETRRA